MTDATPRWAPGWRDLIEVRPYDRDHWVALRAALSIAVPLMVLWAIRHLELSPYAVFAAFTSVFGRNFPHVSRLRIQSVAGLAQLASVAIGGLVALSPHRFAIMVPVTALVAFGASMLGDRARWTPVGPMFQVFAVSGIASQAVTVRELEHGLLVSAASVALAVAVGFAGRLIWRAREGRLHNPYTTPVVVPPPPHGLWAHAAMFATGALVAGAIPSIVGIGHPYWAMISAVAALMAPSGFGRVLRSTHRLVGTLLGLGVGAAIMTLRPEGIALVALVAALQFGIELFAARNYSIALLFMTPMVLLMGELGGHQPLGRLLLERLVETVIGIAVAVAIAVFMERKPRQRVNAR